MKRIAELFNVNTFIVSQTNPFVFPFLDNEDGDELFEVGRKLTLWRVFKYLIGSEMKHRCTQVNNRLISLLILVYSQVHSSVI